MAQQESREEEGRESGDKRGGPGERSLSPKASKERELSLSPKASKERERRQAGGTGRGGQALPALRWERRACDTRFTVGCRSVAGSSHLRLQSSLSLT
jgi:hypothetical protein